MEQDELLTATEDSALLSVPSPGTDRGSWPLYRDRISAFRHHVQQWRTFYSCLLLLFLVDAPMFMGEGPRIRMLEMALCREYYQTRDPGVIGPGGTVPERLCKLRDIQSPLTRLRGFLGLLEGLPGLLFAVPYGILADARGRRLVAGACLLGFILRDVWTFTVLYFYETFPLRAVYAAPTFVLLGGGTTLFGPMIMAIVAATVPEVFRTQAFFYVHVVILVSEMVAPAIGVLLLDAIGPHLTFLVGTPVKALGFIALFFIKEKAKEADDGNPDSAGEEAEPTTHGKIPRPLANLMRYIRNDIGSILTNRLVLIGLLFLPVQKLSRPMLELILQYTSFKFGWPLSRNMNPNSSVMLSAVMIMNVFGAGFASAMRSFLTSLVSRANIALLYTTMALFEGTAVLGAAPLLGLTFSAGVELGGFAVGLPFFVSAGVYGLGAIGVWDVVKWKDTEGLQLRLTDLLAGISLDEYLWLTEDLMSNESDGARNKQP
ncbi:hypothetical protein INS49_005087 [Diaporthe citri]|uniref:uncharacterized protein n=1 Tax=Diaporthe citri TaxID=83186 RepID=UPI001C817F69|nr:uncharacterized protein INS49_005087 [Diaporthe citri]KAG6354116.1 hypothetical protein INS49_005087 [Diaporthe citri]